MQLSASEHAASEAQRCADLAAADVQRREERAAEREAQAADRHAKLDALRQQLAAKGAEVEAADKAVKVCFAGLTIGGQHGCEFMIPTAWCHTLSWPGLHITVRLQHRP
jgi:hypothetical protein